jgi:hypothetical protein
VQVWKISSQVWNFRTFGRNMRSSGRNLTEAIPILRTSPIVVGFGVIEAVNVFFCHGDTGSNIQMVLTQPVAQVGLDVVQPTLVIGIASDNFANSAYSETS